MVENSSTEIDWIAIPADLRDGLTRMPSKKKVRIWHLVLQSQDIPCRQEKLNGTLCLLVPPEELLTALGELRQFEATNLGWPPRPPAPAAMQSDGQALLWVLLGLAVFHFVSRWHLPLCDDQACDWIAQGNAQAGRILSGEWWRTLTALTLHADALHLFSNIVLGGIILHRLGQLFGAGVALLLVLLSGATGNYLNALFQSPLHQSIGASTAVFGAIGLLAVVNTLRYRHSLWRRWPLPIAAALGLFAMLGVGTEADIGKIDIGAHLSGFFCGALIALLQRIIPDHITLSPQFNRGCGSAGLLLILASWWLALA